MAAAPALRALRGLCRSRRGRALGLLAALAALLALAEAVGRRVAARRIAAAPLALTALDVGAVAAPLRARVRGRVARPSALPATFFAARAGLRWGGAEVGVVSLPRLEVRAGEDLELDLEVPLEVLDRGAFGAAGRAVVASETSVWVLSASVDVLCWAFGVLPLYLRGVAFEKRVELEGMRGFSQEANPITLLRITSASGEPGVLRIGVEMNLFNPSFLAARLDSPTMYNVTHRARPFGLARIPAFRLAPGNNTLALRFELQDGPDNERAVEAFVLDYIKAEHPVPVVMHGSTASSGDPLLRAVLDGLSLRFSFMPPGTRFIDRIEADIRPTGLSADARIFNPLPAGIVFERLDLQIRERDAEGEEVFVLNTEKSRTRIPGQRLWPSTTSELHMRLSLLDAHLTDPRQLARLLGDARRGRIQVGVAGEVAVRIPPSFDLRLLYVADNVTCLLECPIFCRPPAALV